jgi:hypothetical protein
VKVKERKEETQPCTTELEQRQPNCQGFTDTVPNSNNRTDHHKPRSQELLEIESPLHYALPTFKHNLSTAASRILIGSCVNCPVAWRKLSCSFSLFSASALSPEMVSSFCTPVHAIKNRVLCSARSMRREICLSPGSCSSRKRRVILRSASSRPATVPTHTRAHVS